jgi:hypothetical protein
MSSPLETRGSHTVRSRFLHWIAELCLVFIGVYGAFWLNSYQERQHEAQRRDRILATLEESVQKSIKRYQTSASNEIIAPNLDQDISFFYDPATKHLRKRFASYPDALRLAANFLHNLATAYQELPERIHAERQHR